MKKLLLFVFFGFFISNLFGQNTFKNALSTSLIRLEKNSQLNHNNFNFKFVTGLEYQRIFNKWRFGIRYEHGYNKINDVNRKGTCYDCIGGTGYLREDNIMLTTNYTLFNLFKSHLKLNIGLGIYYSYSNYSGQFFGGVSGGLHRENTTYNTFGLAPTASVLYYPIERLFIGLKTSARFGISKKHNPFNYVEPDSKVYEFVYTVPELTIGVSF